VYRYPAHVMGHAVCAQRWDLPGWWQQV